MFILRALFALLLASLSSLAVADGGPFPATPGEWSTASCNASMYQHDLTPYPGATWSCKATPNPNIQTCGVTYANGSYSGKCNIDKGPDTCPAGANASTGASGQSLCTCTAGLRPSNGQCVATPICPEGQHEEGGACVPDNCKSNETRVNGVCVPDPPCPTGQSRVNGKCTPFKCPDKGTVSDQWYELSSNSQAATCLYNNRDGTYCTMTIKPSVVASAGGSTSYIGGYGVYTGSACGPSEPGKPTPQDPDKPDGDPDTGTKPPGPNDPRPADKPSGAPPTPGGGGPGNTPQPPNPDGTCPPGTYKSGGQCYSNNPPKPPPDGDGKCPNGYIKVGAQCIPLMPRPDGDGNGDDDKSSFGGQCAAVTCDGDAIQCAMVREQYRRNCQLFENDTDPSSLTNAALSGADQDSAAALKAAAQQVSVGSLDQSGMGWSRSCPADPSFEVAGKTFDIPFSKVCGVLGVLSAAGLGLTLLSCLMWVVGRKD